MARRDAVLRAMTDHPISQRRACVLIGVDPKTVRRNRPPDNPEIREEMHKIAEKRRRFGYRRVGIMLERKGMIMNEKKLYRIYREEGLSVRALVDQVCCGGRTLSKVIEGAGRHADGARREKVRASLRAALPAIKAAVIRTRQRVSQ